eukprot:c30960_g1_i1 orf=72-434(+)
MLIASLSPLQICRATHLSIITIVDEQTTHKRNIFSVTVVAFNDLEEASTMKRGHGKLLNCAYKLPVPAVILLCLGSFLLGFYGSMPFSLDTVVQKAVPETGGLKLFEKLEDEKSLHLEHG